MANVSGVEHEPRSMEKPWPMPIPFGQVTSLRLLRTAKRTARPRTIRRIRPNTYGSNRNKGHREMGNRIPPLGASQNTRKPNQQNQGDQTMDTYQKLMAEAAETIQTLGDELERARSLAIKLEQTMLGLTEEEILGLARFFDSKPVQSDKEELARISGTNKIQERAQEIIFAEMTRQRKHDGKDD